MNKSLITPLLAMLALALAGAGATGAATTRVVMSGLDNPRGLAFGPEGALYVAEAGRGGGGPCFNHRSAAGRCATAPPARSQGSGAASSCGLSAGFPPMRTSSPARRPGRTTSPSSDAGAQITIGWAGEGLPRSVLPVVGEEFGRLLQFSASGNWHEVADLTGYEFATNPDRGITDSNPYGLLAEPGTTVVTDAGGNSLLRVHQTGTSP